MVLQPANHNAGIRPCGCWSNNNTVCDNPDLNRSQLVIHCLFNTLSLNKK